MMRSRGPSATMRPPSSTITRLTSASIEVRCVTSTTVLPCANCAMRWVIWASELKSIALVGSSSAMDFSSEAQITQRVAQFAQGKTVVLVTHRTSMLALVSRVIVIDGGRIVADGPRDRIMEALASGRVAKAA